MPKEGKRLRLHIFNKATEILSDALEFCPLCRQMGAPRGRKEWLTSHLPYLIPEWSYDPVSSKISCYSRPVCCPEGLTVTMSVCGFEEKPRQGLNNAPLRSAH